MGVNFGIHRKCTSLNINEYTTLGKSDDPWLCSSCHQLLFNSSNSINETTTAEDAAAATPILDTEMSRERHDSASSATSGGDVNIFDQLCSMRLKHPRRFTFAYLNINSLRYKFDSIRELLDKNIVDLLFLSETKNNTFPDALFGIDNFHNFLASRPNCIGRRYGSLPTL